MASLLATPPPDKIRRAPRKTTGRTHVVQRAIDHKGIGPAILLARENSSAKEYYCSHLLPTLRISKHFETLKHVLFYLAEYPTLRCRDPPPPRSASHLGRPGRPAVVLLGKGSPLVLGSQPVPRPSHYSFILIFPTTKREAG